MHDELQPLIDGYLDDQLTADEQSRLNALLSNAESARRFALATLLHDRLRADLSSATFPETVSRPIVRRFPFIPQRWSFTSMAAVVALVLVTLAFWHANSTTPASAASLALERVIEVASRPIDRIYRIRVTDWGPDGRPPVVQSGKGGRKPDADGAELTVRGADKFVLVRRFGNGDKFITGSDGEIGWAVAPKGHIHLSRDKRRFRRGVPGEHEEVPFLDLNEGLRRLQQDFTLELNPAGSNAMNVHNLSRLVAQKQSRRRRTPEQVQIWFDEMGVARRFELSGLAEDHGGPSGVVLELLDQRDVGSVFFQHESHHDASRPINWE